MGYDQPTQPWTRTYIAKGVIACFGGLLLHCIIGSFYQWSMINLYVTSYYKILTPSLTVEQNAIAFPLMMFCYGITMRVGIFLTEKIHPLIVLGVLTVVYSAMVFIASYMQAIWGFFVFFGILFALVIGMTFMIPVNQCNKYFPGMKLYVNGVVVAGTGLGPVIFGQFSYTYLNPDKLRPINGYYYGEPSLQELVLKVPSLIRYLSLMYLLLGIISTLMMTPVILHNRKVEAEKKEKEEKQKQQKIKNGQNVQQAVDVPKANEAQNFTELFTSWVFWRHFIIILLLATGPYLMNGNYKTYVKKSINDDSFLTIIGVVGSVVNGGSRFFWSIFFLKTGYKTVALSIVGLTVVVLSTLRFTVYDQGTYMFLIMLINLAIGGIQSSNPSVVQIMFGQKMGQNVYGVIWCIVGLANFVQFFFVSYLGKVLEFNNIIYICLGMSVCVIPIILTSTFQGPWKNPTQQLQYCITCRKPQEEQKKQDMGTLNPNIPPTESFEQLNSPEKKSNNTMVSPMKLPKKLEPISHHEHYQIHIKQTPIKQQRQDLQASTSQLFGSSDKKGLLQEPISYNSFEQFEDEKNGNKSQID